MYFLVSGLFKLLQTDLVLALIRAAGGGGEFGFSVDFHMLIPNLRLLEVHKINVN